MGSPIQAVLDSLLALMCEHRFKAGDVESLVARVDPRGAGIVNNRAMPDINMQHLLAVMLLDRGLSFASAHDQRRMRNPQVLELKKRIKLVASPELAVVRPCSSGRCGTSRRSRIYES